MAELKVGDQVFDEQGVPCNVVAKSPIWNDRPIYRVNTDDGDAIIADENHEWVVSKAKHRDTFFVADTAYVSERRTKRLMVRKQGSLQLPEANLPIDPYILGVWLGDGCSQHATITQSDEDINWLRDQFANCGYTTTDRATHNTFGVLGLQVQLKSLGVINNKHIPLEYLRASEAQRTSLLQGLLDTDGHVSPDGQTEFCTTSLALAEGCLELVRSLGTKASLICGRAMLNGRDCGPKYRVMFYKAWACRLPRKAKRCRDGVKQANRYIDATYVGTGDTVCIEVDSPSHMFLCGRSMLPTHNSEFISKYFNAWTLGRKPDHRHILASYEAEFASEWGRKARDLLDENGQRLFDVKVRQDSKAADHWMIHDHLGGMQTCGVGGPLTGKGADCLPAGTNITTKIGQIDIADLVCDNIQTQVLAFDFESKTTVWRNILARRRVKAEHLFEIETTSGRKIRSTGDHRLFVAGRGYVPASMVAVDNQLVVVAREERLHPVRGIEGTEEFGVLPPVLRQDPSDRRNLEVPPLREGIHEATRRVQETVEASRGRRILLQPRLFASTPCGQERWEVQGLREPEEAGEPILLRGMQGIDSDLQEGSQEGSLRAVWEEVSPGEFGDPILQPAMCGKTALEEDDRDRKSSLQRREFAFSPVRYDEAGNTRSRPSSVCRVRGHGASKGSCDTRESQVSLITGDSSHKRDQVGQSSGESSDSLYRMPHDTPQVTLDTVSVVREIRGVGVEVYDIQVEGCHNFFAGEILVHNCLIIDDPFKNMEEAVSTTIRDKKMDWFRTAAYTRLEPTGAMIMIATRWHEADITGTVLAEMKEGGDQWTYLHLPSLHKSNEVWADLTIPGEHAERIKAHEGMTFRQLQAFLDHCQAVE